MRHTISSETREIIANLEDTHGEAFTLWFENEFERDPSEADQWEEQFGEQYLGHHGTVADYAQQYADDVGLLDTMPANLRMYFDFDAYGRDMELNGEIWEEKGHIFSNR